MYQRLETEISKISKLDYVLDLGTSKRFAKELGYFKNKFKDNYFAFGYDPDSVFEDDNCDVNFDILNIPVKSNCVDAAICLEVLEHVANPFLAVEEIYRVLKVNGKVILTTPFLTPFHGKGNNLKNYSHEFYPDFWRFTHQGLQLLFSKFSKVEVVPFTSTVEYYYNHILKFQSLPILNSKSVQNFISKIQAKKLGCATYRHLVIASK